jgi:uncharacterized protein YbjQ (UPF0145 family)
MIIATTETIAGKKITQTLGLVRGNSIRGRHLGKHVIAILRNTVGGEIPEYTKMLSECREEALDRMVQEAVDLGAHGIVSLRFATSEMMTGAAELLAYGTAIHMEDINP